MTRMMMHFYISAPSVEQLRLILSKISQLSKMNRVCSHPSLPRRKTPKGRRKLLWRVLLMIGRVDSRT